MKIQLAPISKRYLKFSSQFAIKRIYAVHSKLL